MPDCTLFYYPSCGFCRMVLDYLRRRGIEIPLRNTISDASAREELLRIGGKTQVPCLVVDGAALYESRDIMKWFDVNWHDEHDG